MKYTAEDHSFIVCAYKENPYLEECVKSVLNQKIKTEIVIVTSTPNAHISAVAEKYGLPLMINTGETGIAGDWNFALSCSSRKLKTLAHQDDIYLPDYTAEMLKYLNRTRDPIIFTCDYEEIRGEKTVSFDALIGVKRAMRFPMWLFPNRTFAKRTAIAFGNAIVCPSVTYVSEYIDASPFKSEMRSNLDWEKWEEFSRKPGAFACSRKALMRHRISEESETTRLIRENVRTEEDYRMLRVFWPEFIAKRFSKIYASGEGKNEL